MKKRVIAVLFLSIVLAIAPGAMAHCLKCRPQNHTCIPTTTGGFDLCYYLGPDCIIGEFCGTPVATQPLASDFQVASVERLDEPQPQPIPAQTRVASALPATPAARP
ncbi:MAG: hypothetical protein JWO56_3064 [Acidobacteria bacterium]|nr:hypothetical protein [Acidobacteriota bacterium]